MVTPCYSPSWRGSFKPACLWKQSNICCRRAPKPLSASASQRDLWDYDGSCVSTIQLDSFKLFHRLSFGHRNHRTFIVVVYDPSSPSCRAAEYEIERLATGLRHSPAVQVAKLNAAEPDTCAFLAATFPGLRDRLPAVLLYPEAATGYIRLKGRSPTAEDVVRGVNKMYGLVLPMRPQLTLQDVPEGELAQLLYGGPAGLERQRKKERFRRLLEEVAEAREQAATAAAGGEAGAQSAAARDDATRGLLQSSPVTASVAPATPPVADVAVSRSYWSGDRATLWGVMALLSLFAFAWDMWLAAAWDRWQLERRQRKRARGVQFGQEQDTLDLGILLADRLEEGAAFAPSGRQVAATTKMTTETAAPLPSASLPSLPPPHTGPNGVGV
ncbi:hypothetical protein Vretimale_17117 [Volvox reticuliferus]|uniref:Thioredoxin domain-containing protein n=1 Tax=Volvox reticuliferus TaxID=1737510 RepID=A0A8J4LXI6_9CHLO|nr:hypothetical protein Vretimale_17117 [Volvox reticuliferus]